MGLGRPNFKPNNGRTIFKTRTGAEHGYSILIIVPTDNCLSNIACSEMLIMYIKLCFLDVRLGRPL